MFLRFYVGKLGPDCWAPWYLVVIFVAEFKMKLIFMATHFFDSNLSCSGLFADSIAGPGRRHLQTNPETTKMVRNPISYWDLHVTTKRSPVTCWCRHHVWFFMKPVFYENFMESIACILAFATLITITLQISTFVKLPHFKTFYRFKRWLILDFHIFLCTKKTQEKPLWSRSLCRYRHLWNAQLDILQCGKCHIDLYVLGFERR